MRVLMVFAVLVALLAPGGGRDLASEREELRRADLDFARAVASRNGARFLGFLAEDVTFLPQRAEPVHGPDAVRRLWAELLAPSGPALSWVPTRVDLAASGDLGYTMGTYEFRTADAEGHPVVRYGKYVTIWRRQPGGRWKVAVDIGNESPSPATAR
jgi:ketosteroid isomerase-like protein